MAVALSLAGRGRATKRAIDKPALNREETLTSLIERYYEMNSEKRALEKAQKELQQQIAGMLEIPIDEKEIVFLAGDLEARHYYPTLRWITPYDLYRHDPELLWRLGSVPLGAAEQALPADIFHEMVTVEYSNTPQLRIAKFIKKGDD